MHATIINEDVYAAVDPEAPHPADEHGGVSHSEAALEALGRLVGTAMAKRNAGRSDEYSLSDLDTPDGAYATWRADLSALPTFVAAAAAVADDLDEYEATPEFMAALEADPERLPSTLALFGEEGVGDALLHLATLLSEALGEGNLSGAATYAEIALDVIRVGAAELSSIADPRELLERVDVQRMMLRANFEGARRELREALDGR